MGRRRKVAALPERPKGPLIWLHADTDARLSALSGMLKSFRQSTPGVTAFATGPTGAAGARPGDVEHVWSFDTSHAGTARAAMQKWHPDAGLIAGPALAPSLANAARALNVPLVICDLDQGDLDAMRGWRMDRSGSALGAFDLILPRDVNTWQSLHKMANIREKVGPAGPLRPTAPLPDCNEHDLDGMKASLAGRPVWLACEIDNDSAATVLQAHAQALKLLHRLVLVLVLKAGTDRAGVETLIRDERLRLAVWDDGDDIGDLTQVVLAEDPEDIGLWFRLSQLSFFDRADGGLHPAAQPLVAAALGSGILFGPDHPPHEAATRLVKGGAARKLATRADLGQAVVDLIAPHRTARMALAGWEIATEGAEATDRLTDWLQDTLDASRADHARP